MQTQGFYKKDGTQILFALNSIDGPNYSLNINNKDSYTYPVEGWVYADNLDAAINIFSGLQNGSADNLFKVVPENFSLSTDSVSRNAFAQMTTLIQEALSLNLIDNNTMQTITDSQNKVHTLTTLRFRQIMVGYGTYYKSLWDQMV